MYNYFVVRIANRLDGTSSNSVNAYEEESSALKEFFRQAGQAVDSKNYTDSVTMLTSGGIELRHEAFLHDAPAPEPTPEEPTEEPTE